MKLFEELEGFYSRFNGVKGEIGKSHLGAPLYFFAVKKTEYPVVIVQYAIHAREYITTYLALKQIADFIDSGKLGCVYFLPLVNPDGVKKALTVNPLYKANARGVDLNVNFDAEWGKGVSNKRVKGDSDYIGESPFSENETKALCDLTYLAKPDVTVSYHSKGEEIYFEFGQGEAQLQRDKIIADALSLSTGYAVKSTVGSCGGYKDWCISKLKIPAFTIEVGSDSLAHPIGKEKLEEIYQKNKGVITTLTEIMNGLKIYGYGYKGSQKSV